MDLRLEQKLMTLSELEAESCYSSETGRDKVKATIDHQWEVIYMGFRIVHKWLTLNGSNAYAVTVTKKYFVAGATFGLR